MLFHLQETGVIPTEEFPGSWPGGGERVGDPGGIKGCEEVKAGLGSGSHGTGPRCVYERGRSPLPFSSVFAALASGPQNGLGVLSATEIS